MSRGMARIVGSVADFRRTCAAALSICHELTDSQDGIYSEPPSKHELLDSQADIPSKPSSRYKLTDGQVAYSATKRQTDTPRPYNHIRRRASMHITCLSRMRSFLRQPRVMRCLSASYMNIEAAQATFSEDAAPSIGISAISSQAAFHALLRPNVSLPTASSVSRLKSSS